MVGDRNLLDITHIGTGNIQQNENELPLNNILVVPDIKKDLLFVSKLTNDSLLFCV